MTVKLFLSLTRIYFLSNPNLTNIVYLGGCVNSLVKLFVIWCLIFQKFSCMVLNEWIIYIILVCHIICFVMFLAKQGTWLRLLMLMHRVFFDRGMRGFTLKIFDTFCSSLFWNKCYFSIYNTIHHIICHILGKRI